MALLKDLHVDAYLPEAPKAGTIWVAKPLKQHPGICVSELEEPHVIATHKGIFRKDDSPPDWERPAASFTASGVRIDCSVNALACRRDPELVVQFYPDTRLLVCLGDPVDRAVSNRLMVLDNEADQANGLGWADPRLHEDIFFGASIARWLEYSDRNRFFW